MPEQIGDNFYHSEYRYYGDKDYFVLIKSDNSNKLNSKVILDPINDNWLRSKY